MAPRHPNTLWKFFWCCCSSREVSLVRGSGGGHAMQCDCEQIKSPIYVRIILGCMKFSNPDLQMHELYIFLGCCDS